MAARIFIRNLTGGLLGQFDSFKDAQYQDELNADGAGQFTMPRGVKDSVLDMLLGLDDALIEIKDGNTSGYFVFDKDSEQSASAAREVVIAGAGALSLFERALVYPQGGVGTNPIWTFTNATPGTILKSIIAAAQARGTLTYMIHSSFSTTTDSAGRPWPIVDQIGFKAQDTIRSVIDALVKAGYIDVRYGGPTVGLQVYVPNTEMAVARTGRWDASFYAGTEPTGPVVSTAKFEKLDFTNYTPPGLTAPWSMRAAINVSIPIAGTYTFNVTSDDAVRLFVDGTNVLPAAAWTAQSPTAYSGTATLSKGWHVIIVEHNDGGGGERLLVEMTGDIDSPRQPLRGGPMVLLHLGREVTSSPRETDRAKKRSTVLVVGDGGVNIERNATNYTGDRREGAIDDGRMSQTATMNSYAQRYLVDQNRQTEMSAVEIDVNLSPYEPGYDYRVGDFILANHLRDLKTGQVVRRRVMSIARQWDTDGGRKASLELDGIMLPPGVELSDAISDVSNASDTSSASTGSSEPAPGSVGGDKLSDPLILPGSLEVPKQATFRKDITVLDDGGNGVDIVMDGRGTVGGGNLFRIVAGGQGGGYAVGDGFGIYSETTNFWLFAYNTQTGRTYQGLNTDLFNTQNALLRTLDGDTRYLQLTGGTLVGDLIGSRATLDGVPVNATFTGAVTGASLKVKSANGTVSLVRNNSDVDNAVTVQDDAAPTTGRLRLGSAGPMLSNTSATAISASGDFAAQKLTGTSGQINGQLNVTGLGNFTGQLSVAQLATFGDDITLSKATKPTISPSVANNDLEVRSNGTGTLRLNWQNNGPVVTGTGLFTTLGAAQHAGIVTITGRDTVTLGGRVNLKGAANGLSDWYLDNESGQLRFTRATDGSQIFWLTPGTGPTDGVIVRDSKFFVRKADGTDVFIMNPTTGQFTAPSQSMSGDMLVDYSVTTRKLSLPANWLAALAQAATAGGAAQQVQVLMPGPSGFAVSPATFVAGEIVTDDIWLGAAGRVWAGAARVNNVLPTSRLEFVGGGTDPARGVFAYANGTQTVRLSADGVFQLRGTTANYVNITPSTFEFWAGTTRNVFMDGSTGNVVITGQITATSGAIGGFSLQTTQMVGAAGTSSEVGVSGDASITEAFWAGAARGSAPFRVTSLGALYASSGVVGGFTLSPTAGLYSGSGATRVQMQPAYGFWAGADARDSAPFHVNQDGYLYANNGLLSGSLGVRGHIEVGNGGEVNSGIDSYVIVRRQGDGSVWGMLDGRNNNNFISTSTGKFTVSLDGIVNATGAIIDGALTARSGYIYGILEVGNSTGTSGSYVITYGGSSHFIIDGRGAANGGINGAYLYSASYGYRIFEANADSSTVTIQGNFVIRSNSTDSGTRLRITQSGIELWNGGSRTVFLDAGTGNGTFSGNITGSTGTFAGDLVGGTIKTASSGARIEMGPGSWSGNRAITFFGTSTAMRTLPRLQADDGLDMNGYDGAYLTLYSGVRNDVGTQYSETNISLSMRGGISLTTAYNNGTYDLGSISLTGYSIQMTPSSNWRMADYNQRAMYICNMYSIIEMSADNGGRNPYIKLINYADANNNIGQWERRRANVSFASNATVADVTITYVGYFTARPVVAASVTGTTNDQQENAFCWMRAATTTSCIYRAQRTAVYSTTATAAAQIELVATL